AISFGGGGTADIYFRNGDTTYEHVGGIIRNNIIHKTGDTGIYLREAHDFAVYNNTIVNTYLEAIHSRYPASSGQIRHNLMSKGIKNRDGGTHVGSNNITNATPELFVDYAGGDFHLHPYNGMAARDAGIDLPEVQYDIDGDSRPYGSSTDIGADEF